MRRCSKVVDAKAEVLRRRHAGHKPGVEGRWNYDERWRRDGGWYRARKAEAEALEEENMAAMRWRREASDVSVQRLTTPS